MNKTIMILGASILQLPAIVQAKKLGLKVVVVDMNPDAIGFKEENIIKEVISTIDIPAVLEAAKRNCIDGVMTLASDMPMRTVATVCKELNLPGISLETAIRATNKAEMRKALFEKRVPCPNYYKVSTIDDFLNVVTKFSGKFIIKPSDNSGSRGIVKLEDSKDIMKLMDAYRYSKSCSRNGDVLVEDFMEGPEVSVETITWNGKCNVIQVTDKITTGAPHFVEIGHSQPSILDDIILGKIKDVAIAANKAIGINIGPSHTEIIVTKEGPKIVELGARLGGDCITTHLVPLSTGVNMVECCIRMALGEQPDMNIKYKAGSAIKYFEQKEGIIEKISGVEKAKEYPGIVEVDVVHGAGERTTNIVDSSSRIGFVIAQAENSKKALEICEAAKKLIKVLYKE